MPEILTERPKIAALTLHYIEVGHPDADPHRFMKRTMCGTYVRNVQLASRFDQVNCPRCLARQAAIDAAEV